MEQKLIFMNANMIVHMDQRTSVICKRSSLAVSVRAMKILERYPWQIKRASTNLVDGDFSHWSEWSSCTKSCGTGETSRSRTCSEPAPSIPEPGAAPGDDLSIAGLNCTGDYTQVKPCNTHAC